MMSSNLLATGREGAWVISIMEDSASEPAGLSISLRSPSAYLQFNLPDLAVLNDLSRFLRASGTEDRWFELPNCLGGILAFVIHDTSFWIRLTTPGTQMFKISLSFSEANTLGRALNDALLDAQ